MFPLTLTLLVIFTTLGVWLLHYNNLTKRFASILLFLICFILIVGDNWIYLTETEIVNGDIIVYPSALILVLIK